MSSDAAPSFDAQPTVTVRGLAAGQKHFGRFDLIRPLGRGGMGVVWQAHDELLMEDVALKFLPDLVRWDPAALAELKAETRRARQLTHSNIVRIHDLFEDASGAAIAMEFIEGRTLTEERLAHPDGIMDPVDILPWLTELSAALDYAHLEAKVVHRDLKPSNLMLTHDGRIKVTDFGVARTLGETMLRVSQLATGGTLLYMSPQQAFGELPSPRDDIYALGATLYELLTGKPPFYSGNVAAQLERRKPDSVAERRRQLGLCGSPSVPKEWEDTIAACLAKQPEVRPSSAGEVVERLRAGRRQSARLRFGRRMGKIVVGPIALAAIVALGWWTMRPEYEAEAAISPEPALAFPSDALRAHAAWDLDGTGAEASGRGLDFLLSRTVPMRDRFGRIDRALLFNGNASAQLAAFAGADWSGEQPFSLALWVRPLSAESNGTLLSLRTDNQGDLFWDLSQRADGVLFTLGRSHVDDADQALAPRSIPVSRWTHLAVTSDGATLLVYINGREAVRSPLSRSRTAKMQSAPKLLLGFSHKFDAQRFAGGMDELRIWRRAVAADEIARLAAPEPPPRWRVTRGVYGEKDGLGEAVALEFGRDAAVADWADLQRWHRDAIVAWADELGLTNSDSLLLLRAGQRFSDDSKRQYFLNRFEGRKPDYFLAHEELGGMRLALGSWFGLTAHVLAQLPFAAPEEEKLSAVASEGAVRELPAQLRALAVEWTQELVPDSAREMRCEFELRDGRRVAAACRPTSEGTLAVALGDAANPALARQVAATFGRLRFELVGRGSQLRFRAVGAVGAGVVFQEELAVGFTVAEVARVKVQGVDTAILTVEK